MRILNCLAHEHDPLLVSLAALVCLLGSLVTIKLFQRTLQAGGSSWIHWCFLASVCAGAAIWSTHFIAMLGYLPGVPVHFDATLTIVSALIAVLGTATGLAFARMRHEGVAVVCGGGMIGLAISAMHYVGMFGYRPDGIVRWLPEYVAASVACAMVLAALCVYYLRTNVEALRPWRAIVLLVAAIVVLHFVGMAAFVVTPIAGLSGGEDSEVFDALAGAIAIGAVLIVGTGISTHLVDKSRADSEERLREIALIDAVTGLSNRHSFNNQLHEQCRLLESGESSFALFMVDLDRFKAINDSMGHPVGDLLLEKVAERIRQAMRPGDVVARIGGDEFAMIARGISNREAARGLAERIVATLSEPFNLDGQIAEIGASVGVTLAPADSSNAETLTQQADVALYCAKNSGRGCTCLFDQSLAEQTRQRCELEIDLRRAWANREFEVHFQPILDVETRKFTGAEALLRWTSATRGAVSPAEFIPVAEEMGLVMPIGELVIEKACEAAMSWPDHLSVSINVSPVQMMGGRLPETVTRALANSGLPPHRLEIEITETALLGDDDGGRRILEELRALGVSISLDDFGTGYSSLSYLHRFPMDRIKIDRSFVDRLPDDPGSVSIVHAICQLGRSLGLSITAEGIETEAQFAFIAEQGCTHMQGFLYSEPVTAKVLARIFNGHDANRAAA
jgi:diguanylate cyclase (GGDEF)-like protein